MGRSKSQSRFATRRDNDHPLAEQPEFDTLSCSQIKHGACHVGDFPARTAQKRVESGFDVGPKVSSPPSWTGEGWITCRATKPEPPGRPIWRVAGGWSSPESDYNCSTCSQTANSWRVLSRFAQSPKRGAAPTSRKSAEAPIRGAFGSPREPAFTARDCLEPEQRRVGTRPRSGAIG